MRHLLLGIAIGRVHLSDAWRIGAAPWLVVTRVSIGAAYDRPAAKTSVTILRYVLKTGIWTPVLVLSPGWS
jgi:hypothetical protein